MHTRQQPTGGVRLNRRTISLAVLLVLVLAGALVYLAGSLKVNLGLSLPQPSPPTTAGTTLVREPEVISQRPRDYGHLQAKAAPTDTRPDDRGAVSAGESPMHASTIPTPPAVLLGSMATAQAPPPPEPPAGLTPQPSTPPPARTRTASHQRTTQTRRAPPAATPAPTPTTSGKKGWRMTDSSTEVLTSPFAPREHEQGAKKNTLIQEAHWVRPEDITTTLYRSQVIPAMTLGAVTSDIPESDLNLLVTRNVSDRWGTKILIPHNSRLIAKTSGATVRPGQRGLPVTIEELHYPDGTILAFKDAKLHDRSGQAGLRGTVDNHLPQIVLAAGIQALLNIGIRGAAGSPSGYQENLPQQYAAQVGQSLAQTGSKVVDQMLVRPPTISEKAGVEVLITLQENLDLSQSPVTQR